MSALLCIFLMSDCVKPKQPYLGLSPASAWRRDENRSHGNFADLVSWHYAAHQFAQVRLREKKGCGSLLCHGRAQLSTAVAPSDAVGCLLPGLTGLG